MEANKVKYGLNNVYIAKIMAYSDDGTPTYATPKRLEGAVSIALNASGGNENFYADNGTYYVLNNNAGYEGDLEIAMIPEWFRVDILGETYDATGSIVENYTDELSEFALLFEFEGDQNKVRHCLYKCSTARTSIEGETTGESKSVKTEKLTLKASNLANGMVKRKSSSNTSQTAYDNWYKSVVVGGTKPTKPNLGIDSTTKKITITSGYSDATIYYKLDSGDETEYTTPVTYTESNQYVQAWQVVGGVSSDRAVARLLS